MDPNPSSKFKLIKIPHSHITTNPDAYNSNFHPLSPSYAPTHPLNLIPTETPQRFSRWLPLIATSQNISSSSIKTLTLPPRLCRLVLEAAAASLVTREPNRLLSDELANLASWFEERLNFDRDGGKGLFLRLDAASPKDGVNGIKPLTNAEEVVLRLTTSHRAVNAITDTLRSQSENEKGKEGVNLYFLPYDTSMKTELEY